MRIKVTQLINYENNFVDLVNTYGYSEGFANIALRDGFDPENSVLDASYLNGYQYGNEDGLEVRRYLDEQERLGRFDFLSLTVDKTDPVRQVEKVVDNGGSLSDYTWRKRYWGPFKGMGVELIAVDKDEVKQ